MAVSRTLSFFALATAVFFFAPRADAQKPKPKAGAVALKGAQAKGKGASGKGASKKGNVKKLPKKPGSAPGEPDDAARHAIAGTPQASGHTTNESAELKAMRAMDAALFPSAAPEPLPVWTASGLLSTTAPELHASGLPPEITLAPISDHDAHGDLAWLKTLEMPDIPVRWDARVVRYLEYYKNNPRGRSLVGGWIKKSGKYGGSIRRILHEQGVPEDILWLALTESGFDPTISSPAGAAGMWQFVPEAGRIYGLTIDRWVDERLDPERSTVAAARYLKDLHTRFGSWELAFAAYDMGYGGLLAAIRKYGTNDFWELSRFESGVPFETALYVPKIVAMAVVARNKKVFGVDDIELDPAVTFDKVEVAPGVATRAVAVAAGASEATIADLNPQLLANRAPPSGSAWTVRVPAGMGAKTSSTVAKIGDGEGKLERVTVRWGETLDDIAARRGTTKAKLADLNGVKRDEVLRPGTVLFAPPGGAVVDRASDKKTVVVVPAQSFSYPDRKRVFYRVVSGDTPSGVAGAFGVAADELSRWNALDPGAKLHDGMVLQIFAPASKKLDDVLALDEKDARVLTVGSPEFFDHFEAQRGRKRVEVVAKQGDTWRGLASKYGLSMGQMERINQRARSSALEPGEKLVVYVDEGKGPKISKAEDATLTARHPEDDPYADAEPRVR